MTINSYMVLAIESRDIPNLNESLKICISLLITQREALASYEKLGGFSDAPIKAQYEAYLDPLLKLQDQLDGKVV